MTKDIKEYTFNFWKKGVIRENLCTECSEKMDKILEYNKNNMHELSIYHIESQPGDGTLYSYIVYQDGFDEYCFMPKKSSFQFPQRLSYWEVKDFNTRLPRQMEGHEEEIGLIGLAEKHRCNIYTLKECIRTIKELHDKLED